VPRHPPTLAIDFVDDRSLTSPAQRAWLADRACAALAARGGVRGEVRARIVGDAEMAEAHQRWSGVSGTTDVLTFDLAEGRSAGGEALDVDLLLCADEARRQADARGFPIERELLLYLVHGVLHCLGHDDHDEDAFARMHAEEDRLLEAAGVGATYGVDAGGAGR
jgi:probable rRNA maturation factor